MTHLPEEKIDEMRSTVTHEASEVGHLYYVALADRASPPYRTQRHVNAILDIADDGTLAGVELIDNMPPPPQLKELRAQGGVSGLDRDSIRILGRFADQYRSGAQGVEMDYETAQMLALAIDDALSALETEAVAECATEGCERPATNRFEAGGVGSTYCGDCFAKVIELVDPPHSSIPTVTGELIAAAQNVYDKCASQTGTVTILDQERLGDALRALSEESKP